MNDQQPGIPTPEPTPPVAPPSAPVPAPAAVAEPAAAPIAAARAPERAGFVMPKWLAAVVAAVVVGVGGYAIGSASADDGSKGRPAGFSQGQVPGGQGGQSGQGSSGGFGPQGQGGQPSQGSQSGGFGQQGQAGGGMSQHGPMTRSGGS